MTLLDRPIEFTLPPHLIAGAPAERRGRGRDDIRLMVTRASSETSTHTVFDQLDRWLNPGDVIVVNNSATLPASVPVRTRTGDILRAHFADPAGEGLVTVEVRSITEGGGTSPGPDMEPQPLKLPGGIDLHLLARSPDSPRLWVAAVCGTKDMIKYLRRRGGPIRYVPGKTWPIGDYQTIFGTEPGSAEMPSAGRPFTHEMVTRMVSKGVAVVPITLHAGVSSYEEGESPVAERFSVSAATAAAINGLRHAGGSVIAVGTTVVRALETVANADGTVHAGQGTTNHLVDAQVGVRAVDGMLTGWHEPRSSHLRMLEAFLARDRLQAVYDEAIDAGYLWHEFGDELLIIP
jgi:S-adenosylmethionine:tRNA ribosyltransferase-isomerase